VSRRLFWIYLRDICEGIDRVRSFVHGMAYDEFVADDKTVLATERALEIIGEATNRLSEDVKALDEQIPWWHAAGMRDMISHQYDRVRLETIWDAIQTDLPKVAPQIAQLEEAVRSREEETEGE
jgi:uncharacterized protein with HEPN domain